MRDSLAQSDCLQEKKFGPEKDASGTRYVWYEHTLLGHFCSFFGVVIGLGMYLFLFSRYAAQLSPILTAPGLILFPLAGALIGIHVKRIRVTLDVKHRRITLRVVWLVWLEMQERTYDSDNIVRATQNASSDGDTYCVLTFCDGRRMWIEDPHGQELLRALLTHRLGPDQSFLTEGRPRGEGERPSR